MSVSGIYLVTKPTSNFYAYENVRFYCARKFGNKIINLAINGKF